MKKTALALLLVLSLILLTSLKIKIDGISRFKVPGSSLIYIPSGLHLKRVTFGYDTLLADLIYLWAIQYFSNQAIWDRFENLEHVFSIISELDPRYLDPYEIGSLIAIHEARDLDLAYTILDLGFKKNPEQWIFPLQAGHYAQMYGKDFETARRYYKQAMDIEGSPSITRRLYAHAAFRQADYAAAWDNWREVYEAAADQRIKKIASNHLYQTKAAMDIQTLKTAVAQFKVQHGRLPAELEELVKAGFLKSVPKDFDDKDYVYDSHTGEVATRLNPWKR
jgi:tetratricopeptide (TPR) repeat protein